MSERAKELACLASPCCLTAAAIASDPLARCPKKRSIFLDAALPMKHSCAPEGHVQRRDCNPRSREANYVNLAALDPPGFRSIARTSLTH